MSIVKRIRLRQSRHLFNATSTYSLDSDIPTPYFHGRCHLINNSATAPPAEWEGIKNMVAKKERAVAWFVTHCWTSSKRESYVAELRRYIDVDIYGHCGSLRCGVDKWDACVNMVENRYYFYLSFENSLCLDYATEKFWQLINRDVIAVVLGAANYTRLGAVPGTYLDVRDFRSPRLLAEHMKQLMADDGKLYAELIARKRQVQCVTPPEAESFGERLCRYVDSNRGRLRTIDLEATWNPVKICIEPQKFYKGIADMIAR